MEKEQRETKQRKTDRRANGADGKTRGAEMERIGNGAVQKRNGGEKLRHRATCSLIRIIKFERHILIQFKNTES